jgi:hypothetical protein
MTLVELTAKREQILATVGIVRTTYGEKSVEFSKQQDSLALIDAEISRLAVAGDTSKRVSYVTHSRE